ncbi:MAG: hypothetical protein ACRDN8_23790 [Thermoleophilaceae bacterium]
MAAGLIGARRRGHDLPERIDGRDLLLAARFAASVLTGLTISDFPQTAYKAAEERGLGGE